MLHLFALLNKRREKKRSQALNNPSNTSTTSSAVHPRYTMTHPNMSAIRAASSSRKADFGGTFDNALDGVTYKSILSIPTWLYAWIVLSSPVVVWDALFVLLRPHTMAGGKYAQYWIPYLLYVKVDT